MNAISQPEAKKIMLEMLINIADFCDKNNITYFLSSGTLIGAIRHRGFIPWDDDIDIEMPRPDYEKFLSLYYNSGKYSICKPLDRNSIYFYTKIYDNRTIKYEGGIDYSDRSPLGVDIDIFPIDGQPDGLHFKKFEIETFIRKKLYLLAGLSLSLDKPKKIKSRILYYISKSLGHNFFFRLYINSSKRYNYDSSDYVGFISPWSGVKNRHPKTLFENKVKVEFEGHTFWAPAGYDQYLRNIFGNYMQLPPEDQRKTHHNYKIYWR